MDIVEISGKVNIVYNKVTKVEKILTSLYINDVLDTEVYVNTEIHEEGNIKDALDAYTYRLNALIEKYN